VPRDNENLTIRLELPAVNDIVAYLNSRHDSQTRIEARLANIEEKLQGIQNLGEKILVTLTEFATRVDTATNAIATALADLRSQLDPAGRAVLDAAITKLEGIAAGGQPVVPA
jgi:hypothetical protein